MFKKQKAALAKARKFIRFAERDFPGVKDIMHVEMYFRDDDSYVVRCSFLEQHPDKRKTNYRIDHIWHYQSTDSRGTEEMCLKEEHEIHVDQPEPIDSRSWHLDSKGYKI